jgi:Fe-coproporphyrin III synthase
MSLLQRTLSLITDRLHTMPVLVLLPHSRCNCRCIMCDIWQGNGTLHELSSDDIDRHMDDIRRLGVQWVVLSGGEALMHKNIFVLCRTFRQEEIKVTILSTGLLLKKWASEIVAHCSEVIVSLDGSPALHDQIRNIPGAFDRLAEGVAAIKSVRASFRITARCVLQKANFHDLPNIIETARELGLDQVSFLSADVSSQAFNRAIPWDEDQVNTVALDAEEADTFREIMEEVIHTLERDFETGFIAETPDKLRRLITYYDALLGRTPFPSITCNAPWVSTVVEADGTVRPCFFHSPLGNIQDTSLEAILNSDKAIQFRKQLNVSTDPICQRCVCSLNIRPTTKI